MASPFNVFRKNQRIMMVVVGIGCMIGLLLGGMGIIEGIRPGMGGGSRAESVVVKWDGGQLTEQDIDRLRVQRTTTVRYLAAIAQQALENGGTPKGPGVIVDQRGQISQIGIPQDTSTQSIVYSKLLAEKAEEMGFTVTDTDVNKFILQVSDESISADDLAKILQRVGGDNMTDSQLFESLRYELLATKLQNLGGTSGLAFTTPGQQWQFFNRVNRRIEAEVIPLDVSDFASEVPTPNPTQLRAFYEKHKRDFSHPTSPEPGFRERQKLAFGYFQANLNNFMEGPDGEMAKVTDEQIQEYYEKNKDTSFRERDLPSFDEETPAADTTTAPADEASDTPGDTELTPPANSEEATPDATEPPASDSPNSESPASEPATDAPASEEPASESPAEPAPETPAEPESPAEPEAPAETPAEEAATSEAPEAPADSPAEPEAPAEETPTPDAPAEEEPAAEPNAGDSSSLRSRSAPKFSLVSYNLQDNENEEAAAADAPVEEAAEEPAEQPAETPAEEAPAADTPAEQPAADQTQPPADPAADDTPAPKYTPLEKVADEIRRSIAQPKAFERMKEALRTAEQRLQEYSTLYRQIDALAKYESDANVSQQMADDTAAQLAELRKEFEAKRPNFEAIGRELGLTYGEIPLVDPLEIQNYPLGEVTIFDRSTFQQIPFAQIAFGERAAKYKLRTIGEQSGRDEQFLYWITDSQEPRIPEFSEVYDAETKSGKVVDAWKQQQALPLAQAKAEELAEQANKAAKPLDELFKDNEELTVLKTNQFSWFTSGGMPFGFGQLQYSPVAGVDNPGGEFMETAFSLDIGKAGVAVNQPHTFVYVVRVVDQSPSSDALRTQFAAAQVPSGDRMQQMQQQAIMQVARIDYSEAFRSWIEDIEQEMDVQWQE